MTQATSIIGKKKWPIVILLFALISIFSLLIVGYDVSSPGWKVGEKAFEARNVKLCKRIINLSIFGPSTAMKRAQCIRTYAELAKDPSACELLMPSSYGLSCVGVAEVSLPCDVTSVPYSVYWRDGSVEHTEGLRSCLQLKNNRSELGNQCCKVAKVAMLINENDCTSLKNNTPIYDHCLYALAWKQKNPSYCNEITNENAKAACEVQTKALQKNPSICSGCQAPIGNIDQLP